MLEFVFKFVLNICSFEVCFKHAPTKYLTCIDCVLIHTHFFNTHIIDIEVLPASGIVMNTFVIFVRPYELSKMRWTHNMFFFRCFQ